MAFEEIKCKGGMGIKHDYFYHIMNHKYFYSNIHTRIYVFNYLLEFEYFLLQTFALYRKVIKLAGHAVAAISSYRWANSSVSSSSWGGVSPLTFLGIGRMPQRHFSLLHLWYIGVMAGTIFQYLSTDLFYTSFQFYAFYLGIVFFSQHLD